MGGGSCSRRSPTTSAGCSGSCRPSSSFLCCSRMVTCPRSRWRPLVWLIGVFLTLLGLSLLFGQKILTGSADVGVANPFYIEAVGRLPSLDPVIAALFPGIFLASLVSLVMRFRRSSGVERQQIKWVVFAFGVALVGLVSTSYSSNETIVTAVVGGLTFLLLPASIGIAILRYRLYDLDVVVARPSCTRRSRSSSRSSTWRSSSGSGPRSASGELRSSRWSRRSSSRSRSSRFARGRSRFANRLVYGKRATPVRGAVGVLRARRRAPTPTRTSCRGWPACSPRAPGPSAPTCGCGSAPSCGRRRRGPRTHDARRCRCRRRRSRARRSRRRLPVATTASCSARSRSRSRRTSR